MQLYKALLLTAVLGVALLPLVQAPQAQTPAVPYETGKLVWDAPDPIHQVLHHTLKCRAGLQPGPWTHTLSVATPATEALIRDVVPNPGPWICTITATNVVGPSGEMTPVPFVAEPPTPTEVPPTPTGLTPVAG